MNELALFAGAGGGILAGHMLGWRCVCAVEIDPFARSVLLARQDDGNLPRFPVWDDIRTFDARPWRGLVEVVSGGFPCTDISVAGRGAGIDGEHSGLWAHMARVIRDVRPRFAFVENSPALASRGLGRVLGDLAALGYDAEWGVLGAGDVGANHRRDRMWLVAHSDRDTLRREPRRGEPGRPGACEPRHDGADGDDPDPDRDHEHGAGHGAGEVRGQRRKAAGVPGRVAPDTDGRRELQPQGGVGCERGWACDCDRDVGHADLERLAQRESERRDDGAERPAAVGTDRRPAQPGVRRADDGLARELDAHRWGDWREWSVPATVGKLPDRASRLKCLGNGQVPQCAAEAWRQLVRRIEP